MILRLTGKKSLALLALWPACLLYGRAAGVPAQGYVPEYLVMRQNQVELFYQSPDSKVAGEYLAWAAAFSPAPEFLGRESVKGLKIYLAPSEGEFYRLTGGKLPEWGVACAMPRLDLIVVRSPRLVPLWKENPRRILLHEICHVFLDQQLRPAGIPRWFHEGYALYCSEAWDLGNSLELSLVLGNFFPLDSLAGSFPAGESAGRLAYLQSYTVVDYLFTSRDSGELALLFDRWREAGDLDTALRSSYGTTLLKFEQRWRQWAQVRYGWIKLLTSVTLVWIMAAVLFVFVYLSRRALFRRRLEEMKRRESLEAGGQTGPWEQAAPGPGDPQAGGDGQDDDEPWDWDDDPPE